jgi:prepilin-type processing-associated H-X9-DG protein
MGRWIYSDDGLTWNRSLVGPSSYHPGGVNLGFVDGSVRLIGDSISPLTWGSLGTMAGGEAIDANASWPGTW